MFKIRVQRIVPKLCGILWDDIAKTKMLPVEIIKVYFSRRSVVMYLQVTENILKYG